MTTASFEVLKTTRDFISDLAKQDLTKEQFTEKAVEYLLGKYAELRMLISENDAAYVILTAIQESTEFKRVYDLMGVFRSAILTPVIDVTDYPEKDQYPQQYEIDYEK